MTSCVLSCTGELVRTQYTSVMTFEQRKFLVLAAWTAIVATIGIIVTIQNPSLWLLVACLAVVPAFIGNWLWSPPELTLSEIIARHRR